MVSGYKFLTFRLHLWQASSEVAVSTVVSQVPKVGFCFPTFFFKFKLEVIYCVYLTLFAKCYQYFKLYEAANIANSMLLFMLNILDEISILIYFEVRR